MFTTSDNLHEREPLPHRLENLIVIDGPSGSGKDTVTRILNDALTSAGVNAVVLGERELDPENDELAEIAQRSEGKHHALLDAFVRHRSGHIYPSLVELCNNHEFVIVLRGEVTTTAYQTAGTDITFDDVYQEHRDAGVPLPGMAMLVTCNPEEAKRRIAGDRDRDEERPDSISGKVTGDMAHRMLIHKQYKRVAQFYTDRLGEESIIPLDTTNLPPYSVVEQVLWYLHEVSYLSDIDMYRSVAEIPRIELFDTLRGITLVGDKSVQPYAEADLSLVNIPVDLPLPTARYVLDANLIRVALLNEDLDLLHLDGIHWYRGHPIAPPLLERFEDELIIIDGLHRFCHARATGQDYITCIVVEDVDQRTPTPVLPVSWEDVRTVSVVPQEKRVYNFVLDQPPSYYYRDLSPLGSRGERIFLTELGNKAEQRLRGIVMEIVENSRKGFDKPHTKAAVRYGKILAAEDPDVNAKVLITAIYLHDIGYSEVGIAKWTYGSVMQSKGAHMENGAVMARSILESQFGDEFTPEEIDEIVELVRIHDNVETVVDTLLGRLLMEADTLGSFEIAATAPTYTWKELRWYLQRNKKRRVRRFQTDIAIRFAEKLIVDIERKIEEMKLEERASTAAPQQKGTA